MNEIPLFEYCGTCAPRDGMIRLDLRCLEEQELEEEAFVALAELVLNGELSYE